MCCEVGTPLLRPLEVRQRIVHIKRHLNAIVEYQNSGIKKNTFYHLNILENGLQLKVVSDYPTCQVSCVAVRHAVCLMARYLRFYLPLFSVESPLISLWRTFNFVFPVQHFSVCTFPFLFSPDRATLTPLSSSYSLCQGWGAARNFFTASSDSLFHPPLYLVFFFQSSSSPVFFTPLLTQSSPLSLGLPRLLLPSSRNSAAPHPPSFQRVLPTVACSFGF